jgi:hypothetical protein
MGCGDGKLSKYLTQTFTAHCNAMICQQVTLSGDAEWPKVADAVIEAFVSALHYGAHSLALLNEIRIRCQQGSDNARLSLLGGEGRNWL